MSGLRVRRLVERGAERGGSVGRGVMVAVASVVVAAGTVTGTVSALGDGRPAPGARAPVARSSVPSPSGAPASAGGSVTPSPARPASPE
ncbi:endoglucanase, partial [Streptomyces sp. NPDC058398]